METTEKKLSLVERFNQVGEPPNARWAENHPGEKYYPNHYEMGRELAALLQSEAEDCLIDQHKELLAEYRKHFNWDMPSWSLRASWELTADTFVKCEDLDELKEYLNKDKDLEVPDASDVCVEDGYLLHMFPQCYLTCLKLKEKSSYSLVLNVECEKEQEGIAAAITDLINQSSKGLKVVSCTQAT